MAIADLLNRYPTLCYAGFLNPRHVELASSREDLLRKGPSEIKVCLEYLDGFKKLKRCNPRRSSYGLKHRVEHWTEYARAGRVYISNGSFIVAALLAGFELTETSSRINVDFNISEKDVKRRDQETDEGRRQMVAKDARK